MSSLATIRSNIRTTYLKIDPNAKVWSDGTVDYFSNIAYWQVQSDFWYSIPECEASTTITTIAATQEYDKPSDFARVSGLFQDNFKLTPTSKQNTMINAAQQSKPASYYLYWSKIGLYPTPDTTYTISMLYCRVLPSLSESQDSELPTDMEDLVVLWACYLMFLSVEKEAKARLILNQYMSAKDSLFWKYMYDDDSMTYSIPRNNIRPRQDAL